jgi:lysozyme
LALKLIQALEGLRLTAYWDYYGKRWTIGFGHTGPDVRGNQTISLDTAYALATVDMLPLDQLVKGLPILQAAALISFGYNCGRDALKRVLSGSITVDHEEFWARESQTTNTLVIYGASSGGKVLEALQARRALEASLIEASKALVGASA